LGLGAVDRGGGREGAMRKDVRMERGAKRRQRREAEGSERIKSEGR